MTGLGVVIVASTSAAAGTSHDATGPVLVEWLTELGFTVSRPVIVADGAPVGAALKQAIDAGASIVVTTGGTGVTPDDRTPEETARVIDCALPGIPLALQNAAKTPMAALGRGLAGFAGATLIINLPGSPKAVREGIEVLTPLVPHAVDLRSRTVAASSTGAVVEQGGGVVLATVTEQPLSQLVVEQAVARRDAGAVAAFMGVVRDHDEGQAVTALTYEAHPVASTRIAEVAARCVAAWPSVTVAVQHRIGALDVGDIALAAAVSSAHRAEAFAALTWLVDEVKRDVPIWKLQFGPDRDAEWLGATGPHSSA